MGERLDVVLMAATGNRFMLVDAIRGGEPDEPAALAREVCAGGGADGVLLLLEPEVGGDCRMVVFNADGSRPEACGNGLRCIARLAVERRHVPGPLLAVETDAGLRQVRVIRGAGGAIVAARAEMGVPRVEAERELLEVGGKRVEVGIVDVGNPHCVLFVEGLAEAPVVSLGAEIERHARFPERVNVEFVDVVGGELRVRIFERGVGETASCGSGVSAAAVIAIRRGVACSPVEVMTAGGRLRVHWDGEGALELEGGVGGPATASRAPGLAGALVTGVPTRTDRVSPF